MHVDARKLLPYAPLAFFGALLATHSNYPSHLIFDEIAYVPASKALATFADNLNWVHPPLAKWIMGLLWLVLSKLAALGGLTLPEPFAFRFAAMLGGIAALAGVAAWMRELGFSARAVQAATWLTGFNFLWFVQSRTAMLDIFYAAFCLWGLLLVTRSANFSRAPRGAWWWGWALLGLGAATKWAAAPFFVLAAFLAAGPRRWRTAGFLAAALAYTLPFVPLGWLDNRAVAPSQWLAQHREMLAGFGTVAAKAHPYISRWWEWPALFRPMWYAFETGAGTGEHCVWAGGNPVLFWASVPLILGMTWATLRASNDRAARTLALLYWVPLLFWAITPRKLQLFYYYLVPSLWLGPIVVWAHERSFRSLRSTRGWLLLGFTLLCGLAFLYFLPIMDGRPLEPGQYRRYMWLRAWI